MSLRQRQGLISWATTELYDAAGKAWHALTTRLEPSSGLASEGYEPGTAPSARVHNWLFGSIADGINRLRHIDLALWYLSGDTTPNPTVPWASIAYDSGADESVALIVASDGEARATLDGMTWHDVSGALAGSPRAALYCGGAIVQWYVVGASTIYRRHRDLTTTNWTSVANPVASDWNAIAFSSTATEKIVIVGSGGKIGSSDDGLTFANRSPAGSDDFNAACWAADLSLYVVVGDAGRIFTSPDGITWTARTSGVSVDFVFVTYDPRTEVLLAVASNGTTRRSFDGVTWTAGATMSGDPVVACAHDGEGTVVAIQNAPEPLAFFAYGTAQRNRLRATVDGGASWEIVGKISSDFIPRSIVWAADLGWLAAGGTNLLSGSVHYSRRV